MVRDLRTVVERTPPPLISFKFVVFHRFPHLWVRLGALGVVPSVSFSEMREMSVVLNDIPSCLVVWDVFPLRPQHLEVTLSSSLPNPSVSACSVEKSQMERGR